MKKREKAKLICPQTLITLTSHSCHFSRSLIYIPSDKLQNLMEFSYNMTKIQKVCTQLWKKEQNSRITKLKKKKAFWDVPAGKCGS